MLAAFGLHRTLPQEVAALLELRKELVVEVVAVGDDHDCRAVHRLVQEMRVKHHRERLARSLRMPEHACLLRPLRDSVPGRFNCLPDSVVLVVAGEDLVRLRAGLDEAHEVLQDVEEPRRLEDASEEYTEVGESVLLAPPVRGLPLHEAVFPAGDRADAGMHLVGDDAELVEHKRLGHVLHVVAELEVGIRDLGRLARRGLQLGDCHGKPVQQEEEVEPLVGETSHFPLAHDPERVSAPIREIHELDERRLLLTGDRVGHLHATLEVVREYGVALHEVRHLDVAHLLERLVDGDCRQVAVEHRHPHPHLFEVKRLVELALDVIGIDILPADPLEELDHRAFVCVFDVCAHF